MILPETGRGTGAAGGGGSPPLQRPIVAAARRLRKQMSPPEVIVWQHLRTRPAGLKFRRQHPIGRYVTDFCCLAERLIVEIDGKSHELRSDRDAERDKFLEDNGYRVIRIEAAAILRDVLGALAPVIALAESPLHQPSAGPPPRFGED